MTLPTHQQCLDLFKQYKVPDNIKQHCLAVQKVAVFLATKLQEAGIDINLELVSRTALLHDIFKVVVLEELKPCQMYHPGPYSEDEIVVWKYLREKYPNMYETEVAYEIFKEEYPELAVAVKNSSDHKNKDKTWEELIVHYADWRIFQNEVVLLDDRLAYLKQRYPRHDDAWELYKSVIKNDELKIFKILGFPAEELRFKMEEKLSEEKLLGEKQAGKE